MFSLRIKMAAKEKNVYGRSEQNPARPNTDISKLTLRDSSGEFNNELLEQYILLEIYTNTKKFDINAKEPGIGFTPLHWAVSCANIQGTRVLVKHGADVHVRDCMGFTPLFYCTCQFPNVEMAAYLIAKCNARVDDRSDTGGTCLQGAAFKGNTDIVRCLLKFGADPKACNKEGTTAFNFARGHQDILDLLHKANSKSDSSKDKQRPCANCGKSERLKRCARCQVTYYCSKECQSKHWKQGNHRSVCEEGVIAEPGRHSGYHVTLMNLLGAQKPAVAVFGGDTSQRKDLPAAKRFVVKVQRPTPSYVQNHIENDLMVYNVDRSVDLFIKEDTPGYDRVVKKITDEGIMGLKAYFWAERVPGKDKLVKVFPGKFAPPQEW